jgi:hypothetical protein
VHTPRLRDRLLWRLRRGIIKRLQGSGAAAPVAAE